MKNITDRGRKIISRLFRVISVSAASLILQACYGMIPPDEPQVMYGMPPSTSFDGKVVSKETNNPIFGIEVSLEGSSYSIHTREDGSFFLDVPDLSYYTLKLKDTDGPYNGGLFKEKTLTFKRGDKRSDLLIDMDLDN